MSYRPVGCLSEVTALRVLFMCSPRHKRYLNISYRRTRKNSRMFPLVYMRHYKSLPVLIKLILARLRFNHYAAVRLSGFKFQVNFRIMSQRFKVAYALNRACYRFLIDYASLTKLNSCMKSVPYEIFEYIYLNLTHYSRVDFLKFFIPHDMKSRFFLFKSFHIIIKFMYIVIFLRCDLVCHNGL